MDAIDRAIIEELRRDARISNVDLADRVGLTPAPCLRRLRRLEKERLITGYHAVIDPTADRRGFDVVINVDLVAKDRTTVLEFERAAAALHEVVELRRMFGLPDYVVRVAVADLESFEAFVTDRLEAVPGIAKVDSHLTMKRVK
ncbi:MAG: Lrp/AsnC family transcriptional regulator [Pseudonocardia sp.]